MNLSYEHDLLREGRSRQEMRNLLSNASQWFGKRSVMERLYLGKDVPARKVLAAIDNPVGELRLAAKYVPREHQLGPEFLTDENIGKFRDYVAAQVVREAVEAAASRLVKAADAAGFTYSSAQSMFTRAMDKHLRKHPDSLGSGF